VIDRAGKSIKYGTTRETNCGVMTGLEIKRGPFMYKSETANYMASRRRDEHDGHGESVEQK